MKFLVQFSRILIGLLFILSGLLKLNDPMGFAYKLEEYFTVFESEIQATPDSLQTAISITGAKRSHLKAIHSGDSIVEIVMSSKVFTRTIEDNNYKRYCEMQWFQSGKLLFTDTIDLDEDTVAEIALSSRMAKDILLNKQFILPIDSNYTKNWSIDISAHAPEDAKLVTFFSACKKKALHLSIFISWLEAIIGFALLIGFQARFTGIALALVTLLFTYLTYYTWANNAVTDCGCFGEAMPMSPRDSFIKNLVLLVFIGILIVGAKKIKPIFSNPFGVKILTILSVLLIGFSLYCKHYLPVVDFLKFKEGNDIRLLSEAKSGGHEIITYRYTSKDGSNKQNFKYDSRTGTFNPPLDPKIWEYDTILETRKSGDGEKSAIHDFVFMDASFKKNEISKFWEGRVKLLWVMEDLSKVNHKSMDRVREIIAYCVEHEIPVWALTSSSPSDAEKFRHENQLADVDFHFGDQTQLKSIIRSNPGLLLVHKHSIVRKQWPSTRLPSVEKLQKLME